MSDFLPTNPRSPWHLSVAPMMRGSDRQRQGVRRWALWPPNRPQQQRQVRIRSAVPGARHRAPPDQSQTSFSEPEYAAKKKLTRRERFFAEIEAATPWAQLVAVIEPH